MYGKMISVQTELKCNKGQYNSFGGYSYRSCEDILEAVKPLLGKYKLLLNINDEVVQVGERYYVKATATVLDAESDKSITSVAYAREPSEKTKMDAAQITGATSSYARKYALNGLFCIDDTKDADTDEYAKQTKPDVESAKAKVDAPKLTCEKCNKVILGYKGRGGKEVTPEQHIAATKKQFGMQLCLDCAKAMNKEKEN